MDRQKEILIIEDDADIREGIRILLESQQYAVKEAENGEAGLAMVSDTLDLIILDIMMPGISGIRVCEEVRKVSNVPVLFLTAKSLESDKLLGLMAGGDDYLTKPFSYAELLGRVSALVRRYNVYQGHGKTNETEEETQVLSKNGIQLNSQYNEVQADQKPIALTDKEYRMLRLMMQHPGRVYSAQQLYESVWEEPFYYSCNSTVMVHIRKLRTKVEADPQNPKRICTVWGKGYCFAE